MKPRGSSPVVQKKPSRPSSPFRYWAFISYSQKDASWGRWLHRRLEGYRPPGKARRQGPEELPGRLAPVFLDRDELASSSNLGESVRRALEESMVLIVICSPRAAASRWVDNEVRTFQSMGRGDQVLCCIIDGEPNAEGLEAEECLPEALRAPGAAGSEGYEEPLGADVRKDGRNRALLKLISAILRIPFDILWDREKRRKTRQRLRVAGVSLVLVAVLGALGAAWLVQRRVAEVTLRQRDQQTIREQLFGGDVAGAVALLGANLSSGHGSGFEVLFRFWYPMLRDLDSVLAATPDGTVVSWRGNSHVVAQGRLWALPEPLELAAVDPSRRQLVTLSTEGTVQVWSLPIVSLLYSFRLEGMDVDGAFRVPGSSTLVLTGRVQASSSGDANPMFVVIDPRSRHFDTLSIPFVYDITADCRELIHYNVDFRGDASVELRLDHRGKVPAPRPLDTDWIHRESLLYAGCEVLEVSASAAAPFAEILTPLRLLPFPDLLSESAQWRPVHARDSQEWKWDPYAEYDDIESFVKTLRIDYFDHVHWSRRLQVNGQTVIVGWSAEGARYGARHFCRIEKDRTAQQCEMIMTHGNHGEMVFSPNGRFVLISDLRYMEHPCFHLVRLPDIEELQMAELPSGSGPTDLFASFSPSSSELAVVAENGEIWIYGWDAPRETFTLLRRQTLPGPSVRRGDDERAVLKGAISAVRFAGPPTLLVARDAEVWAIDWETRDLLWRNSVLDLGDGPIHLAVSSGSPIFAAYTSSRIRLYETGSGAPLMQVFNFQEAKSDSGKRVMPHVEIDLAGGVNLFLPSQALRRDPPRAFGEIDPLLRTIATRTGIDPKNGRSPLLRLPGTVDAYVEGAGLQ